KTSLDHSQSNREYPFVRTAFKKYNKVFDLNEFKLSVSDPSLFDQKRSMLTTTQLMSAIDSIDLVIQSQKQSINQYLPTTLTNKKKPHREDLSANQMPSSTQDNWPGLKILFQQLNKAEQASTIKRGRAQIRTILAQLKRLKHSIPEATESRVKHAYALQMKYSMALVCIIFVLIGASMGAIVRKGDFGYPILVSIIFFILFIVLTIFCRKLAEAFVLHEIAAGWMPCIILFPIGLWLTFMAKNDRELNIISIFQGVYDRITKLALLHKTNMSPPPDAK
ncbi:MAG: LptF/LptG family permease, partial [Bacteroidota bacterium]